MTADALTEEPPRSCVDLCADALATIERLDAGPDYRAALPPNVEWELVRLARIVAELAQRVDAIETCADVMGVRLG